MTVIDRRYGVAEGLAVKAPCRLATTANTTLAGLQTVDGVVSVAADRVLVKAQTTASQNGIYVVSTGNWTRDLDFDGALDVTKGTQVRVTDGNTNAGLDFVVTTANPIVIGTTGITFSSVIDGTVGGLIYPVVNPSSGNFQGAGFPIAAQVVRSDQNAQYNADVINLFSSDPSSLGSVTVGGAPTAGDVITLHFVYSTFDIAVSYTVPAGATTTTIAAGLWAAIVANTSLFTPADGTTNLYGGGYTGGKQLGYVVPVGPVVYFDYDSRHTLNMRYTVSGAATETITFPAGFYNNTYNLGGSTPGATYQMPNAWDNNPAFVMSRAVLGVVPPAGSVMAAWYASGADSNSIPFGSRNVSYGTIALYVGDSTFGHKQSAWVFTAQGGDTFSEGGGGVWIGQGLYANTGSAPFHNGLVDKGPGTANFATYYINGRHTVLESGTSFQIGSAAGYVLTLSSAAGVGINAAPSSAGEFRTDLGMIVTGSTGPATGTGVAINFAAAAGNITARNFTSLAYQTLNVVGLTIQLAPSASATSGVIVSANAFTPAADNVTQSGSTIARWTSMHSMTHALYGATSGSVTLSAAAIAGSNTIKFPAGSTDFSATGGANQFVKQTSAGGAFTVATITSSDLSSVAAALTKTDDTNVTLTLGGSPTTALLAAASLTLGWTGTLAPARGGTGVANNAASTLTISGNFATTITVSGVTGVTLPTAGTLATLAGIEALTNKTINNLTITSSTGALTIANSKTLTVSNTLTFTGTDGNSFAFPSGSDTVVTLAASQELASKTLNASVGKGTWTASGTWTLPAFTLNGTVSGGGNQINNVIIGTVTPLAGSFAGLTVTSSFTATGLVGNAALVNSSLTVAGTSIALGASGGLSTSSNSIGADVALNNTANYFDGPSVAQGVTGTWFASGAVSLTDTAGAATFYCKLWDGTTVIDSIVVGGYGAANANYTAYLCGTLASPAGNLRISARDITSTSGKILFNASGLSKDSSITVVRIA